MELPEVIVLLGSNRGREKAACQLLKLHYWEEDTPYPHPGISEWWKLFFNF